MVYVLAIGDPLRTVLSEDPTRRVSRPDIVRSGASRRRPALPRLALLRPERAIGVLEQPVWTLALGFKLRGVQCSRFHYPLNDLGLITSFRRKCRLDVLDRRLELLVL